MKFTLRGTLPTRERKQRIANARLIASAPEMYEALRGLYDAYIVVYNDPQHKNAALVEKARRILAAIEGKE